jgi:hypothetical protein
VLDLCITCYLWISLYLSGYFVIIYYIQYFVMLYYVPIAFVIPMWQKDMAGRIGERERGLNIWMTQISSKIS